MALELAFLSGEHEKAYEELLMDCSSAMLYHSLAYRLFLKDFLPPQSEDCYLLAFDNGRLVGALPTFLIDGPNGVVLNSLPFFGSHGSIILAQKSNPQTASFLAKELHDLCVARKVTYATVIDTPFIDNEKLFHYGLGFQYKDYRIGQFTALPQETEIEKIDESLLALYHQKTRNIVRKALGSGLVFSYDQNRLTLDALHALHEKNMLEIGGIAKPRRFFKCISSHLKPDLDYRIYTARNEGNEIVCALMLLYYKDMVEYFVPATANLWRSAQPLSALIHIAMRDAVSERNAKIWNWGGTWPTQDGVYHFKSRWGTKNYNYNYYIRIFPKKERVLGVNKISLLSNYPWFYTVPFSILEN